MRQTIIVIMTISLLLISGCATQTTQTAIGDSTDTVMKAPLKIGMIIPLTGFAANSGRYYLAGAQLAQEDIKSRNGDSILLVVEDSKSDAKEAATAANKLVSVDMVGVIYTEMTGPAQAASPIAKESGRLFFYDAFTPQILAENPYSLKLFFDPSIECGKLARIAKSKGKQRPTILIAQSGYTKSCEDSVLKVFPNATIQEFPFDTTEFNDMLTKIKSMGSDVIISLANEPHYLKIHKQKKDLGVEAELYCGSTYLCLSAKALAIGDTTINGTVAFEYEIDHGFADKLKFRYPEATENDIASAAADYDAVMYTYRAWKKCGNTDRDCLLREVLDSDYKSMIVSSGFGPDRQMAIESTNIEYTDGKMVKVRSP